jgi:selenocysteine-specific translation elongation factor
MAKTIAESFEAAVTAACTRALERGRTRVKMPAAVVRGLMVELKFHRKMHRKLKDRVFYAERDVYEMADVIRDLRDQVANYRASLQTQEETINTANARAAAVAEDAAIRVAAAEKVAHEMDQENVILRDQLKRADDSSARYLRAGFDKNKEISELLIRAEAAEAATVAATKRAEETAGAALKQIETYSQFLSKNMPDWKTKLEGWMKARNG